LCIGIILRLEIFALECKLAEEELQVSNFKSFEYNINYFIILIPYHFNSELLNLLNLNLLKNE
jgi:hypothetical protein